MQMEWPLKLGHARHGEEAAQASTSGMMPLLRRARAGSTRQTCLMRAYLYLCIYIVVFRILGPFSSLITRRDFEFLLVFLSLLVSSPILPLSILYPLPSILYSSFPFPTYLLVHVTFIRTLTTVQCLLAFPRCLVYALHFVFGTHTARSLI
ncbi:hypothetical protein GGI42DRAFT_214017 [Trichoderma sp. SZMC 28013]